MFTLGIVRTIQPRTRWPVVRSTDSIASRICSRSCSRVICESSVQRYPWPITSAPPSRSHCANGGFRSSATAGASTEIGIPNSSTIRTIRQTPTRLPNS